MTCIVTSTYRYKRPPRTRKPGPVLEQRIVAHEKKQPPPLGEDSGRHANNPPGEADREQPSTPPERQRDPAVTTAGKAPHLPTTTGNRRSYALAESARRLDPPSPRSPRRHQRRLAAIVTVTSKWDRRYGSASRSRAADGSPEGPSYREMREAMAKRLKEDR